jgi:hypothetical protein
MKASRPVKETLSRGEIDAKAASREAGSNQRRERREPVWRSRSVTT